MKFAELRTMSKDDLEKQEKELKFELMKLNAQISTGTNPKNPAQVRKIKKSIAQIKTVLTQNETRTDRKEN